MAGSKRWLARQRRDPYVQRAQKEGYPSRAAYKLLEIQERDRLIRPGMTVVDLGAAPGGWTQVAVECLKGRGRVLALDCLPMNVPMGVSFIQGDFTEAAVLQTLMDALAGGCVDLVISDMAPNLSGQRSVDQPRMMHLLELAHDFARRVLRPGGALLMKCFEGEGVATLRATLKQDFSSLKVRKPPASRDESREYYLLADGFHHA